VRSSAARARRVLAVAAASLLVTAPAGAVLLDHEYIAAYTQLGRLRMLSERVSKQNLLYQLHLADQHKLEVLATVNAMNEALEMLRAGSPMLGVPAPPSAEIAAQLDAIALAWRPVETMATASPFDYLRRSREFVPPRNERGDPLRIAHFDRMTEALDAEVVKAVELYIAACKADGYERCELGRLGRLTETRAERLVKQAVFVFAGMNVEANRKRLAETRAALEDVLIRKEHGEGMAEAREVIREAVDTEKTPHAAQIVELRDGIRDAWRRLDREIELVDRGHAEEANLKRALSLQQLIVSDMQRLNVAIELTTTAGTLR